MHRTLRALPVLLLAFVVSGCLGPPPAGPAEVAPQAERAPPAQHTAPAGTWSLGDDWRYEVTGTRAGTGYTVRAGVVAAGAGTYTLAVDSTKEHGLAISGLGGVLVGKVGATGLAPHIHGSPRDVLGLAEGTGTTWEIVFLGTRFNLVKGAPTADGHRVVGTAHNGETLLVEYSKTAVFFSRLEWRDGGGQLLLGYRLVDRPGLGAKGLTSWDAFDAQRVSAVSDRVVTATVRSDGEADLVLIAATVGPARTNFRTGGTGTSSGESGDSGGGLIGGVLETAGRLLGGLTGTTTSISSGTAVTTVLDPSNARIFEFRSAGGGFRLHSASDAPGAWQLVASTGGPSVDLVVYRIQVAHH